MKRLVVLLLLVPACGFSFAEKSWDTELRAEFVSTCTTIGEENFPTCVCVLVEVERRYPNPDDFLEGGETVRAIELADIVFGECSHHRRP